MTNWPLLLSFAGLLLLCVSIATAFVHQMATRSTIGGRPVFSWEKLADEQYRANLRAAHRKSNHPPPVPSVSDVEARLRRENRERMARLAVRS